MALALKFNFIELVIGQPWSAHASADQPIGHVQEQAVESSLPDQELAAAVITDPEAFLPLFQRYYPRILNYLYRRTMQLELAEDLTSKTFLAAYEDLRRTKRSLNFRPWIYRIATNVHLSHTRRRQRWLKRIMEIGRQFKTTESPSHNSVEHEEMALVRRELVALPEKYRSVLILRYDESFSYEEIVESLGISPTAARTRVSRGLAMLKKRLAQSKISDEKNPANE